MFNLKKIMLFASTILLLSNSIETRHTSDLTLIVGSMCSGKTEAFIAEASKYLIANPELIGIFKPNLDDRVLANNEKDPAMFIPGALLAISLSLVLIIATVLWPYGLFQQAADRLWIHNKFLLTQYAATSSSAQKAAVAVSMVVCGSINAMFFVVAAPIYLGRLYFTWISTAPVLHTSLSVACLLGLAIFIYVILPLLLILAICSIIIAANEK